MKPWKYKILIDLKPISHERESSYSYDKVQPIIYKGSSQLNGFPQRELNAWGLEQVTATMHPSYPKAFPPHHLAHAHKARDQAGHSDWKHKNTASKGQHDNML